MGALYAYKTRQLAVVPSGQGKSVICAAVALIARLRNAEQTVHLVFENKDLMKRDQDDF